MNTQAQLSQLDRANEHHRRTEVLSWDGRLDNRSDLLLLLADSLRGETSNAALARAAYERWGAMVCQANRRLESCHTRSC